MRRVFLREFFDLIDDRGFFVTRNLTTLQSAELTASLTRDALSLVMAFGLVH